MSLGDISFIAAFIVFPLIIVAMSILALRTLNRRQRRPMARFSANTPAESTQELPIAVNSAYTSASRKAAATTEIVEAAETDDSDEAGPSTAATQTFRVPAYRGRSRGVVRRIALQPRSNLSSAPQTDAEEIDPR